MFVIWPQVQRVASLGGLISKSPVIQGCDCACNTRTECNKLFTCRVIVSVRRSAELKVWLAANGRSGGDSSQD
jgi:hypothetical protein